MSEGDAKPFKWTVKRRRFVYHYARNQGNGTKAADAAGYAQPETEAWRLLKYEEIKHAVEIELRQILSAEAINDEYIISKWANWVNVDKASFYRTNRHGEQEVIPVEEWTPQMRACVKKVTINNTQHGQNVNIEFEDRKAALDNLAKVTGLLNTETSNVPPEEAAKLIRATLALMDNAEGQPDDTT